MLAVVVLAECNTLAVSLAGAGVALAVLALASVLARR